MFKDTSNTKDTKDVTETIIGQSVKIEGDFKGQGNIVVEGVVNGSFFTDGNLRVGEQAEITASIEAESAYIAGNINGNLKIKKELEISPSAKINGDIETSVIIINKGAIINGSIKMGEPGAKQIIDNKIDKNEQKKYEEKNNNFG